MNYDEEIENLENKIRIDRNNLDTLKQCVETLFLKVEYLEKLILANGSKENKKRSRSVSKPLSEG
jgi:hypothetical protein